MSSIDIEKLNKFNEALSTLKQINHIDNPYSFILKRGDRIQFKSAISFMDISSVDYILVIGHRKWTNGPYVNFDLFLAGMFDSNLDLISYVPISDRCSLIGIEYVDHGTYDSVYPELVVTIRSQQSIHIKLGSSDLLNSDTMYQILFDKAKVVAEIL